MSVAGIESADSPVVARGGAGALRLWLRAAAILAMIAAGAPIQMLARRLRLPLAGRLPVWFHRCAVAVIGLKLEVEGAPRLDAPLLLVSNHMSWLDIVAIGSRVPARFVAKSEIAGWPVFGALARLQGCLFVNRARRGEAGRDASRMGDAMAQGHALILFAEGTTSDGCAVLPFRSALLGAVEAAPGCVVQPLSIVYYRRDGLPLDAAGRRDVAWWGDKSLMPHLGMILRGRSIHARLVFGEPAPASMVADRKTLTARLEAEVRAQVEQTLRRLPA